MPSDLAILSLGAFAAALVAGLAGFAFGLVASAIWLHVMAPAEAVPFIVASGLTIHLVSLWRLKAAVSIGRLWPFVAGGMLGVPLGVRALQHIDAPLLRTGIGILMVVYSAYGLLRPRMPAFAGGGRTADGLIGVVGGVLGGAAGLNGVIPTIWCDLRGWPKDDQRGVYQPYIFVTHGAALAWLGGTGAVGPHMLEMFAMALPALALGAWLGLHLYGRVDAAQFRKVLLGLLLVSGVGLVF
jgi:uncharacterized protein